MTAWPSEPEILAYIEKSNAVVPDELWEGPVEDQRRGYALICAAFREARPQGLDIADLSIDADGRSIPARFYKPGRRESMGHVAPPCA